MIKTNILMRISEAVDGANFKVRNRNTQILRAKSFPQFINESVEEMNKVTEEMSNDAVEAAETTAEKIIEDPQTVVAELSNAEQSVNPDAPNYNPAATETQKPMSESVMMIAEANEGFFSKAKEKIAKLFQMIKEFFMKLWDKVKFFFNSTFKSNQELIKKYGDAVKNTHEKYKDIKFAGPYFTHPANMFNKSNNGKSIVNEITSAIDDIKMDLSKAEMEAAQEKLTALKEKYSPANFRKMYGSKIFGGTIEKDTWPEIKASVYEDLASKKDTVTIEDLGGMVKIKETMTKEPEIPKKADIDAVINEFKNKLEAAAKLPEGSGDVGKNGAAIIGELTSVVGNICRELAAGEGARLEVIAKFYGTKSKMCRKAFIAAYRISTGKQVEAKDGAGESATTKAVNESVMIIREDAETMPVEDNVEVPVDPVAAEVETYPVSADDELTPETTPVESEEIVPTEEEAPAI